MTRQQLQLTLFRTGNRDGGWWADFRQIRTSGPQPGRLRCPWQSV